MVFMSGGSLFGSAISDFDGDMGPTASSRIRYLRLGHCFLHHRRHCYCREDRIVSR